jgi:beta-carotene ketolase (CrtW type)
LYNSAIKNIALQKPPSYLGLFIALLVIGSWLTSTLLLMHWQVNFANPLLYLFILLQMHLYTGLFITAHDAMHGTVAPNKTLNNLVGYICTFFTPPFGIRSFTPSTTNTTATCIPMRTPTIITVTFFAWYVQFIRNYLSIWQIVVMAILFNVFKMWVPQPNLILFWVVPSLLSTLQLFYFGTYLPHKGEHDNKHQSRSLPRNHFLAFFSCYFFGYHYEHHDAPWVPWWKLWGKHALKIRF